MVGTSRPRVSVRRGELHLAMIPPMVLRAVDLRHRLRLLSPPFSLPNSSANPNTISTFFSAPSRPILPHRILCRCSCRRAGGQSWDSNAETVRSGRFRFRDGGGGGGAEEEDEGFWRRGKRKWWSDDSYDELDEDSDLFEDVSEQPWDKIWIFKVFKSYGYLFPAIIASMLLATGPKAFLMALALPLGQSALSLAIKKVWGNAREEARPRSKAKKKPFARSASDFKRQEGEESARTNPNQGRRVGYQSWVEADVGAADKESDRVGGAFGGWDELDRRGKSSEEPTRRQPPRTTAAGPTRAPATKKGKLTRRGRNKDVPFFLRLLIAVFPFLGSWTRIL